MDVITLAILLQHVREVAEQHLGGKESDRFKIITPLPSDASDFPDFDKTAFDFSDPQTDRDAALQDAHKAYLFSLSTNSLYYNFSYGLTNRDYSLESVCSKFYGNSISWNEEDSDFSASYLQKKDAYETKYKRGTAGDLGKHEFRYTSFEPIQWKPFVLEKGEIDRFKEKAIKVYGDLGIEGDYLKNLITHLSSSFFSKITYDLGFFDIIRDWIDPLLFENHSWKFKTENSALYGEGQADFSSNDVKLCYAQRFYVVKNVLATMDPNSFPSPEVRDHRNGPAGGVTVTPISGGRSRDGVQVRDHRTNVRNRELVKKFAVLPAQLTSPATSAVSGSTRAIVTPPTRAGYVWKGDHWERKRAGEPDPVPVLVEDTTYRVAAVLGRVIPRQPSAVTADIPKPTETV